MNTCVKQKNWRFQKNKVEFYDEIRESSRYDEDEDAGDEVEVELLQAMRESRKTAYMDELRRCLVFGFPSSSMLGRYRNIRDNPICLEREAIWAHKQFEKTRDIGAAMADIET